jgi:hypothetical protein
MREALQTAIKFINFIRSRALSQRILKAFCQELEAEYEVLLYCTEVRWLSGGQVLKLLFELRAEASLSSEIRRNRTPGTL